MGIPGGRPVGRQAIVLVETRVALVPSRPLLPRGHHSGRPVCGRLCIECHRQNEWGSVSPRVLALDDAWTKKWPPGYPRGRCVGLAVGPASTRTIPEAAFRYRRGRRHDGISEDRGRADTAARTGSRCRGPCRPRTPSPGRGRSRRFPPISVRRDRPDQASRS